MHGCGIGCKSSSWPSTPASRRSESSTKRVSSHLAYAVGNFHCLLDGELFLPESWSENRERCEEAGIPEDMVYRPKWQIALELYDDACRRGVSLKWLVFDEGYGGRPPFLRALDAQRQRFVGEVPKTFASWIDAPRVTERPFRRHRRGRPRKTPRLVAGSRPAQSVEHLFEHHPALRDQSWDRYRVKDGEKGPMVWEVKHTLFYPKDAQGLPAKPYHLLVGRNVLKPNEIKFFAGNAPQKTKVETLLLVGFSYWRVERCFQDQKSELELDAYEGRRYSVVPEKGYAGKLGDGGWWMVRGQRDSGRQIVSDLCCPGGPDSKKRRKTKPPEQFQKIRPRCGQNHVDRVAGQALQKTTPHPMICNGQHLP